MKMKTKMTILDQELSQSAVGMYEKYLCVDFLWLQIPVFWVGLALLSLHMSQVAHQAGAYPSFCSMKLLGVCLLPPGRDASQWLGYSQL